MISKIVVGDRIDEYQLFDPLGVIESKRRGNSSTVRAPNDHRPPDAQAVHQTRDHPRLRLDRIIEPTRFFGITETQKVGCNDPKTFFGYLRSRRLPNVVRRRIAVEQDDRRIRSLAEFLVMHTSTVDIREVRVSGIRDLVRNILPINRLRTREHLYRHRRSDRASDPYRNVPFSHSRILYQNYLRLNRLFEFVVVAHGDEPAAWVDHLNIFAVFEPAGQIAGG